MNKRNIVFRTDASIDIGSGHVMRCLTLANALSDLGAKCQFICRAHDGNLIKAISDKGYAVYSLPAVNEPAVDEILDGHDLAHASWLSTTQEQDALDCVAILDELQPKWLIVDHYALDARWERALRVKGRKTMIIDDLADRMHECDLLLDQTFGRKADDYRSLVPSNCQLLCGSDYALLRPEFSALRAISLKRRTQPQLHELLVTMGGLDKANATQRVLVALRTCSLPVDFRITVVLGAEAPWVSAIRDLALTMPWPTRVLVGVNDMAGLMAESDLAIGAAGSTSWERCCLGLPTILVVVAENQRQVALELGEAGAAKILTSPELICTELPHVMQDLLLSNHKLSAMSCAAAKVTDGHGVQTVVSYLE